MRLSVERCISELSESAKRHVYLDPQVMKGNGLEIGTIIRIRSERGRSVLARVAAPFNEDRGRCTIRLDRFFRQGIKARLNEDVEVEKFSAHPVREISLVPAIDVLAAHDLKEHLKESLVENQTPVSPGSVLYLNFPHSIAGTTYTVHSVADNPGIVTDETVIKLEHPESHVAEGAFDTTFEDVGGLDAQVKLIRELIQLPLQMPHIYRQLGINAPHGVIFYGPPGTGKTHLARAIANEIQAKFYYINGPDIVGTMYGETEGNLRKMFNEATHHAPSIIMIDELDALAPKRGETGSHSDTRAVTQLLALLDGLRKVDGVVVVGTTNRIEAIDVALRRPGRFDREVFFAPPDAKGRSDILQIHSREMPLNNEALDYLPEVAEQTIGYVGADLMELCREAGLEALRRNSLVVKDRLSALRFEANNIAVTKNNFDAAIAKISPSALREIMVTIPGTKWNDIGGLEEVKKRLVELIELPLAKPDLFSSMGIVVPKGILLHGPAGTGKTLLAKAIANECKINFLSVEGPEIFTKWLGESEEAVRHIFRIARQLAPTLIFFDQLDAIAPKRGATESRTSERVVNQLLVELDGMESLSGIIALAATNRLDLVDPSVLRPGRLSTHLYVPLPDLESRKAILKLYLNKITCEKNLSMAKLVGFLAERTEGCSGAELRGICEEAKFTALRKTGFRDKASLSLGDFEELIEKVKSDNKVYLRAVQE